jgi:hypothetical protein
MQGGKQGGRDIEINMEREWKQRDIKTHKSSREREREIAREIAKKRGGERETE